MIEIYCIGPCISRDSSNTSAGLTFIGEDHGFAIGVTHLRGRDFRATKSRLSNAPPRKIKRKLYPCALPPAMHYHPNPLPMPLPHTEFPLVCSFGSTLLPRLPILNISVGVWQMVNRRRSWVTREVARRLGGVEIGRTRARARAMGQRGRGRTEMPISIAQEFREVGEGEVPISQRASIRASADVRDMIGVRGCGAWSSRRLQRERLEVTGRRVTVAAGKRLISRGRFYVRSLSRSLGTEARHASGNATTLTTFFRRCALAHDLRSPLTASLLRLFRCKQACAGPGDGRTLRADPRAIKRALQFPPHPDDTLYSVKSVQLRRRGRARAIPVVAVRLLPSSSAPAHQHGEQKANFTPSGVVWSQPCSVDTWARPSAGNSQASYAPASNHGRQAHGSPRA